MSHFHFYLNMTQNSGLLNYKTLFWLAMLNIKMECY